MNPTFTEIFVLVIGSALSLGAHVLVIRYTYHMRKQRDNEKLGATIGFLAQRVDSLSQDFYHNRDSLTELRVEVARIKGRLNFKAWKTGE